MIARHGSLLPLPWLLLALAAGPSCEEPGAPVPQLPPGPRTVVLISIDTLRPERLGVYGNTRGSLAVSPRIDALAQQAVVFEQALAASPWTLPSHMTMLTGLDPTAHGVHNGAYKLSQNVSTLAEVLKQEGFATGAFTDGGFVESSYGFDQGFDVYEDERSPPGQGPNGFARLLPAALTWLRGRASQDVFLFVHTFDVHAPYDQGDPEVLARFRQRPVADGPNDWGLNIVRWYHQQKKMGLDGYLRMQALLNDYDAGVFEADRGIGEILDVLQQTGRADSALVVITSDHGESFFDHELHVGHGLGLGDDELRVPLIVRFPTREGAGTRRPELVGLVDVARTVLEACGLSAPDSMQGESLLQLVRGRKRQTDYVLGASQNTRSLYVVRGGFKYVSPAGILPNEIALRHLGPMSPPCPDPAPDSLVYDLGTEKEPVQLTYDFVGDPLGVLDVVPRGEALFDRRKDSGERFNLVRQQPELAQKMRNFLLALHKRSEQLNTELFDPEDDTPSVDTATQRTLEALGYLATGSKDDFKGMGKFLRDEVRQPHVPVSTALLVAADRSVHAVRARHADGATLGPADAAALQEAGMIYRRWFDQHRDQMVRVSWRVAALLDLGARAGLVLDPAAWLQDPLPGGTQTGPAPAPPEGR